MSRSRKKPIYKDKGMSVHQYWSTIRHEWKQITNKNYDNDDFYLRDPKSIINDYDYCDYWFEVYVRKVHPRRNCTWCGWTIEDVKKYSRK